MIWKLPVPLAPGQPRWGDLIAGLCVAGLLLPEAVAYAGLAHLPVANALVAMVIGLALYALLGTSRFAIVAPTSSAATLAAAAVLAAPEIGPDPAAYMQALLALVLMAGALLVVLGLAGQGQVAAFVSRPVLRGFAFALAVTIVARQLPEALGMAIPHEKAQDPVRLLAHVLQHHGQWHGPTLWVALAASAVMIVLKPWRQLPAAMLTMALAIGLNMLLDLQAQGVQEVGAVTLPAFHAAWPQLTTPQWLRMGELAFGLVLIVFAESWGSIRSMALAHGESVDANRELIALGACNIGAALLQGMPVGAGFSASSANASAGACSRWAGLAALLAVGIALAVALPAVQHLPRAVLAVVVIHALLHALNPRPLVATWKTRRDRLALAGAVLAVLALGVLHGMLVGVGLSLLSALHRFSQPLVHDLGELPGTRDYIVVDGRPHVIQLPGLLVLRPEEPLFFANADRVCGAVLERALGTPGLKVLVLSLEESSDLDSTAVEGLLELDQRLRDQGQTLVLSRVKDAVRELLALQAPAGLGRHDRLFWSVADAVDAYRPGTSVVP